MSASETKWFLSVGTSLKRSNATAFRSWACRKQLERLSAILDDRLEIAFAEGWIRPESSEGIESYTAEGWTFAATLAHHGAYSVGRRSNLRWSSALINPLGSERRLTRHPAWEGKVKRGFRIIVARLEALAPDSDGPVMQITFRISRGNTKFFVPILLRGAEFDDTELLEAARSYLHETFSVLAEQTKQWELTQAQLRRLSKLSRRPANGDP
jgi:hypothetical protein